MDQIIPGFLQCFQTIHPGEQIVHFCKQFSPANSGGGHLAIGITNVVVASVVMNFKIIGGMKLTLLYFITANHALGTTVVVLCPETMVKHSVRL